ncbi:MAG: hypothetical protein H7Z14_01060 [Anaerolineae bacterium]|nr:hypothetical protein [Phycisphaerae bacterium]
MSDDRPTTLNDASDPLDAMLAQARWPEAKLDARARLTDAYREARSVERSRIMFLRTAVALAASVMIVIGVSRFAGVRHPPPGVRQPVQVVVHERAVPIGRPPTQLESAIIASKLKQEIKTRPAMVQAKIKLPIKPPEVTKPPVNVDVSAIARELSRTDIATERRQILLVQLLREASIDAVRVYLDSVAKGPTRDVSLAALDGVSNPPVDQFMVALRDPLVDRRIAAARALGYIDGPVLTARLIKMAEADQSRREVMVALACSRGDAARTFLDRASASGSMVGLARSVRVQFDVR